MARYIFVDSCAFDELFKHRIEPSELDASEFQLFVTGDVLEELSRIPDRADEPGKKAFIDRISKSGEIPERGYFGFGSGAYGFGRGILADLSQTDYLESTEDQLGAPRRSGTPKNATDRQLLSHAIVFAVLTNEATLGNKVLMDKAVELGATVIRMRDFDPAAETFIQFLRRHFPD
ncbi:MULTISPECIES: hypothetical protein [unclassified Pseudomonas]